MERNTNTLKITKARVNDPTQDKPPWIILVIDDNRALLKVTHNILKNFRFNQRPIQVECAHSAQDGRTLYQRFTNAAIILLDCVMETDHAGLDFVKYIREEENNREVQIILRTGQPGIAPEKEILRGHALNDYLDKSQLSAASIRTRVTAYLRNYENLKTLLGEREALAGSIAHEVKNPLGQVDNSLRRIREVLGNDSDKLMATDRLSQLRHLTETGQQAVKRSNRVIDTVLSEMQDNKASCHDFIAFSARQAVQTAIDDFYYQEAPQHKRIMLEAGEDFTLFGDPIRFNLILFNLFHNSLCYVTQQPGLHITLGLNTDANNNQITVKDNGPGIAAENIAQIFDRFYTDGKAGGTGLGLAYCQRTMRFFGGKIECDSMVNKQTVFTLTFPLYSASNLSQFDNSTEALVELLKGKKILIVDDEVINREVIYHVLAPLGVAVLQSSTGGEALHLMEQQCVDAVITDLHLLESTGTDLTLAIREGNSSERFKNNQSIPIIAITGEPRTNIRELFFSAGGTTLLGKPLVADELISTLAQVFTSTKLANEIPSKKEQSRIETPTLIAAAQLHHDMTTPLLTLETYGRLFDKYLPQLIESYVSTSNLKNIPVTILNDLSIFVGHYLELLKQCRIRHQALWPTLQSENNEAKQSELLSEALVGYHNDWSTLHTYHTTLLEPALPILINNHQMVKSSAESLPIHYDQMLEERELYGLAKAANICIACSEKTLSKLTALL